MSTVGAYLRRWCYTAQRPKKQAVEQQPGRIQRWLAEEYPAIERRAKAEGAEIHWCDESGLRTDANYARSYAPKGQTPVIRQVARRGRTNLVSTVSNRGKLRFMVYDDSMHADTFIEFLRRLLKTARNHQDDKKIFLILDNLRVHHAKKVRQWVENEKRKEKIELFFLPPYAPQYNPDEFLNNDVKQNVNRKRIPRNSEELKENLRAYLKRIQRMPEHIRSLFRAPTVRYAAG